MAGDDRMGIGRPGPTARVRAIPFAAVALFALTTIPLAPITNAPALAVGIAANLALLAVAIVPWPHAPDWIKPLPALLYFPVVVLLREGSGGAASGLGFLTLLPILWLGLYAGARAVVAGVVLSAATFVIPILLIGGSNYPVAEWRRAALSTATVALVGWVVQRLVTRLREESAVNATEARVDPLTGLWNRRTLTEQLAQEVARARRRGSGLSVVILDLDRFKAYNDRFGHIAGDKLLVEAARAWLGVARAADTLVRYGGEEFVVVAPDTSMGGAVLLANRLRGVVPREQTCSAGVAEWIAGETAENLLARADSALYDAKRSGRDRVVEASSQNAEHVLESAPVRS